jgi:phenylpyruvate tautomerase PptA (4-oxalocrotonate tautomerase family)
MAHVIVKLWPGLSEQQKRRLAGRILEGVVTTLKTENDSVSIAIEEVAPRVILELTEGEAPVKTALQRAG